jgi:hypothetical protein
MLAFWPDIDRVIESIFGLFQLCWNGKNPGLAGALGIYFVDFSFRIQLSLRRGSDTG